MCRIFPVAVVFAMAVSGCSSNPPTTSQVAKIDCEAIATAILNELDKNRNGSIDADELSACLSLKAAASSFDQNNDRKIDRNELIARLERYNQLAVDGAVPVNVTVKSKGVAVSGVLVTLTPETFLGPTYRTATGTTDADGIAGIKCEGNTLNGLPPGLYRITLSKDGKPLGSPMGREIIDDGRSMGADITISLP